MKSIHSDICNLATVEVEEILKIDRCPWKYKTTLTIQSVLERGFLCPNLSNFFYNRRRVFFRSSVPCSNKLLKEMSSKGFILRMHVNLPA